MENLSIAYCIPFVGMLLSIAIFPLVKAEWWEHNKQYPVIFWSVLFLIPFAVGEGVKVAGFHLMEAILGDYVSFIVLLFGLFCVSGNICVKGELSGTPKLNTLLLFIGAMIASWVGTTGASMLLIRPIIRANYWRKRKVQTIVFFIFLVSNIGGCLTPVGDPPLLMGFMRGVPFTWSFHLLPVFLINLVLLLAIYFILDTRAYKKDLADGLNPEKGKKAKDADPLRIEGAHNFIFLALIVGAVILSGVMGGVEFFKEHGIAFTSPENGEKEVLLNLGTIIEMAIILVCALLSFKTTKKETRTSNNFSWAAIEEVAVLFIGIFITMIPALIILKTHGAELGLTKDWQMFWATGALSSFLDNTPTYLVFFQTAQSLVASQGLTTGLVAGVGQSMLLAISCGAVFMGANTYIGNAPNFMVKSIAEENKIKMPSFFGYMGWSVCFLIPVFLLDTLLFFSGLF